MPYTQLERAMAAQLQLLSSRDYPIHDQRIVLANCSAAGILDNPIGSIKLKGRPQEMVKRRTFSPEFKFEAVLELVRGDKSIAQICRERDVTESLP